MGKARLRCCCCNANSREECARHAVCMDMTCNTQVSDTTYINSTFAKTDKAFITMLEELKAMLDQVSSNPLSYVRETTTPTTTPPTTTSSANTRHEVEIYIYTGRDIHLQQ
eukprot:3068126-Amphidinium_carterae.1